MLEDPSDQEPAPEPEAPGYWAATFDPDEMATEIRDRVKDYFDQLSASGLIELWSSAHAHFYSLGPRGHEGSKIIAFGDDGEKLGVKANHLRSIGRYILNVSTAEKASVQAKAVNSTAKARAQIPTANRVIEYYHQTKRFHRVLVRVALRALLYGKGFLWQGWDPSAPDGGDLFYKAMGPLQVASDLTRDEDDHDWHIALQDVNKYDLAAQYPHLKEELEALDAKGFDRELEQRINFGFRPSSQHASRDMARTMHFMHRRTPALPDGRYVIVAGNIVLFDGPLPYKSLPISEMTPEEFAELGSVGYSSLWDLIGLQQYYDAITSTGMSNMDALGHNDILLPEGVELGVEEIRDGLNVIRYPAGESNKPSMLEKFQLREEYFKLRDSVRADMETLPGVNQVARGTPEASLKSGSALALVEAQAIKFQTGTIAAWNHLVTDVSTKSIEILAAFCPPDRVKDIAGANDPDGVMAFTSGRLDMISSMECEQVGAVFSTLGGRWDAANNALERGLITDTSEYYGLITSGRPEVKTGSASRVSVYYEHVKEVLMSAPATEGSPDPLEPGKILTRVKDLPVTILDDPRLGLKAASDVMNSIENRSDPNIAAACTAYAMEVVRVWRMAPIDVLVALGYPPAPSVTGAMPGQEEPGAEPAKPGEHKPDGNGKQISTQAPDKGAGMPSLPKPAKNPMNKDANG